MTAGMRVGGGGSDPIRASLVGDSGQGVGDVLDMSLEGAAVQIPLAHAPSYFVGEHVVLNVGCGSESVEIMATVRNRTETDTYRRFGLTFIRVAPLSARVRASLVRIVNYRTALRVEPAESVPVHLQIPEQACGTSGRMRDVSANGLAVLIDPTAEKLLSRVTQVGVEFWLPGSSDSISCIAAIRNRHLLEDEQRICIGVSFEAQHAADFASHQRRITAYVVERQSELLRALMRSMPPSQSEGMSAAADGLLPDHVGDRPPNLALFRTTRRAGR